MRRISSRPRLPIATTLVVWFILASLTQQTTAQSKLEPAYQRTSYTGESTVLENAFVQLKIFKRIDGWAWGELSTASGKMMGVLDHLGEIMLRDQDIPMRLTADTFRRTSGPEGESIHFDVKSIVVREKLEGTSFEEWMRYPFTEPCLVGEVTLTLLSDQPVVRLAYRLTATGNYYAKYIRGPWLKVGEGSFGVAKDDSMFPGVEWTIGDEWSSGTDYFKDPWALRVAPHPNQVTIPLMALSHAGTGIGLSWNPNQVATRWFNYRSHIPQPVFATPNFVDRMNNNLMGLMIPDATVEGHQNEIYASQPLELRIGQQVNFDAEIWLSEGNSLDVVTDWVKRNGLPEPPAPKWDFQETLDRIANAYNTHLWHEGKGFGIPQKNQIGTGVPGFLERYVREHKGTKLAKELRAKMDWCYQQRKQSSSAQERLDAQRKRGDELLEIQREDGSFYFDPHGRHYRKDDFIVATSFVEPMGREYDTALDIVILPALNLLDIAATTGDDKYSVAARKALDYAMEMMRPEGGDFWETPLHAANLLAAGHAAIAYYEGYKAFNDERYKEKAIYWMRSIIPFTHLWQPMAHHSMMYNTKPVLSSSDWYFANWVRDHVQWEVLSVFRDLTSRGIQWGDVDPEIDWRRFHEGITVAAVEWLVVHTDNSWRPHNVPSTFEDYQKGAFDYTYPDTHNSITGNYGGMFIMPDPIAANIYGVLDERKKN
ncbi:hypothetical protein [Parapedobacter sp. 10938]|uniref:hypothetical protein n=1 Tax=Parapedobacter flavus TaxID=3110225 RepID=UPI002DB84B2E|nr:hypothetical protein [Parapedobacter sp. 10938]MEC3880039.1 hypothetical protein [Parapedobacter sp. 10938]